MRRSLLVYNPAAGQRWRRPFPDRVRRHLLARGFDAEVLVTRGQDHATELVRRHLDPAVEVVWVCGGDGTLGQAAAALVGSEVPLGIVPSGTVNVIARECGLPADPLAAVDAVAGGAARRTFRIWSAGGRAVMLGVGVGFEARAIGYVPPTLKEWLGAAGVGAQGVGEWARYEFPALRVRGEDGEGRPFDLPATQLLATSPRRFAGHHVVAPRADPADACLDLLLFQGASRARLAAFWLGVQLPGTLHLRVPGVRAVRARRLRVDAAAGRPVEVHVNGDAVDATPLEVEPWGAVRVLAPAR
ncbi:MAG TPA: diacylglycerol kinase family protein [Longimicrobiaceae bacterium]